MDLNRDFSSELSFSFTRSSGAGGQNVNKVNTKVELRFSIPNSQLLSADEKEILKLKLATRINNDGDLVITSQTERSQLKNKEAAIKKFYALIVKALTPRKKRKATKPSASAVAQRLDNKRLQSRKKTSRKNIDLNE